MNKPELFSAIRATLYEFILCIFINCVYLQIYSTCNECKHNLFGSIDAGEKYDVIVMALSRCSHTFSIRTKAMSSHYCSGKSNLCVIKGHRHLRNLIHA